jgi:outer membrane protein
MIRRISLLVFGIFLTTLAMAQAEESKTEFTLKEAQDYAVKNSYFTRSAIMDVTKSEQRVKEITGIGLPQVAGKASYSYFAEIPTSVVPANSFNPAAPADEYMEFQMGTKHTMNAGIQVNQLLFDGSYIVGLKASKTYRELAYANQAKTEAEIRRDIVKGYGLVLTAEENYKLLQENEEQLKKLVEENTALFEAGFMEDKDLDQIKLLLLNTQNTLIQIDNQRKVVLDMLKFTMGKPIKEELVLKDNIDDIRAPFLDSEANLTAKLTVENHVDYRRAEVNLRAQELTLDNEKYQYAPKLYGFLNYEGNAFGNEFNFFGSDGKWFPTAVLGVQLNVPIFTGFQRHQKVQQAQVGVEQAELQLTQMQENLNLDLANKRNQYEAAILTLENQKENRDLAKKINNQTQIKYREGVSSSVELTQTQNQYLNSEINYISAVLEVLQTKADLDYALARFNN